MAMGRYLYVIWLFAFLISPAKSLAQQIVSVDPNPLKRPTPLVVVKTDDAEALLKSIVDAVKNAGFDITTADFREAMIEAQKQDNQPSKGYDRVIIWLERDFLDPSKFVKLYFLYGRYESLLGAEKKIYRIKVAESYEEEKVGKFKQFLISIANAGGGQK